MSDKTTHLLPVYTSVVEDMFQRLDVIYATIPTNISTTRARQDMVLIDDLSVNLLELTIPTNTYKALQAARNRKSEKPLYL